MLMPAGQTVKPPGTATAQIRSNFAQLAGLILRPCRRAWKIEAFYFVVRLIFNLPISRTALRCRAQADAARVIATIDTDPQASQSMILA
jgi:hypothetical protein